MTLNPRKNSNSKGLLLCVPKTTVGSDRLFTFLSMRHTGGTHASTTLKHSDLQRAVDEKGVMYCVQVVCDGVCINENCNITPYSEALFTRIQDSLTIFFHYVVPMLTWPLRFLTLILACFCPCCVFVWLKTLCLNWLHVCFTLLLLLAVSLSTPTPLILWKRTKTLGL